MTIPLNRCMCSSVSSECLSSVSSECLFQKHVHDDMKASQLTIQCGSHLSLHRCSLEFKSNPIFKQQLDNAGLVGEGGGELVASPRGGAQGTNWHQGSDAANVMTF